MRQFHWDFIETKNMQYITCLVGLTRRMQILHISSFKEQIRPMCKYSAIVKSKPPPWEWPELSTPACAWLARKQSLCKQAPSHGTCRGPTEQQGRASIEQRQPERGTALPSKNQRPASCPLRDQYLEVGWLPFLISCHLSLQTILLKFIKKAQGKALS
jgi:hypothetical protein